MKFAADLFCGAGGTSTGLLMAAAELNLPINLLAVNHWNIAIDTHTRNHPSVRHLCESLDNLDPRKAIPGGKLHLLCASPECTHHSNARGGRPCADQSRATAWHICRWAEALMPDCILIENVREFRSWGPLTKKGKTFKRLKGKTFEAFLTALRSLGYRVEHRILNCADYGDATTRQRLFIIASRRQINWPAATHAGKWRAAREIIDWTLKGKSIYARKRPLSKKTLGRIDAGLEKFNGPFLIKFYGTNKTASVDNPLPTVTGGGNHFGLCEPFIINTCHAGGPRVHSIDAPVPTITCANRGEFALIEPFLVQYFGKSKVSSISAPLPTVTTNDRFGLIQPEVCGDKLDILFRMLQPGEYARAMSFPDDYQFAGNRGDHVRQIGNAVPVRTAAALCKELLT